MDRGSDQERKSHHYPEDSSDVSASFLEGGHHGDMVMYNRTLMHSYSSKANVLSSSGSITYQGVGHPQPSIHERLGIVPGGPSLQYGEGIDNRRIGLMHDIVGTVKKAVNQDRSMQLARPSTDYHVYKSEFHGTTLRIYVPKQLEGSSIQEAVRFQLGGDNGIGKALELGNSRSSFKGNRDKIKEGKNHMSVISIDDALAFLDRTTKDRGKAQLMKRYLQEEVLPKLERGELAPWTGVGGSPTAVAGLTDCLKRLLNMAEKVDHLVRIGEEGSLYLRQVRAGVTQLGQGEKEVLLVLVGEPGSGKSHLGNRLTCANSDGQEGPFPTSYYSNPEEALTLLPVAARHVDHGDPHWFNARWLIRSKDDFGAVLRSNVGVSALLGMGKKRHRWNSVDSEVDGEESMPALPDVMALFPSSELDSLKGIHSKMRFMATHAHKRISPLERLAVEALLFESPAVTLPQRFTIVDTPGCQSACDSLSLQLLLRRADVIIPCARTHPAASQQAQTSNDYPAMDVDAASSLLPGGSLPSVRSFAWEGLFFLDPSPIVLICPDYVPVPMPHTAASSSPKGDDPSRPFLSPILQQKLAAYRNWLAKSLLTSSVVPHFDLEQRLRPAQQMAHTMEILPSGSCSLAELGSLSNQLSYRQQSGQLNASCTLALIVNTLLHRFRHLAGSEQPLLSPHRMLRTSTDSYLVQVVAQCEMAVSRALKSEVCLGLEEARSEVEEYLESCAWNCSSESALWTRAAQFIVGVFRQLFHSWGDLGCRLRIEQQKVIIAVLEENISESPASNNGAEGPDRTRPSSRSWLTATCEHSIENMWEGMRVHGLEGALGLNPPSVCHTQFTRQSSLFGMVREELRQAWALHSNQLDLDDAAEREAAVTAFAVDAVGHFFAHGKTLGEQLRCWAEGPLLDALNRTASDMLRVLCRAIRSTDERKLKPAAVSEQQKLATNLVELTDHLLLLRSQTRVKYPVRTSSDRGAMAAMPIQEVHCTGAGQESGGHGRGQRHRKWRPLPKPMGATSALVYNRESTGQQDVRNRLAWVQFPESPLKHKEVIVGSWADRSCSMFEHFTRPASRLHSLCPPVFFISKDPFSAVAMEVYNSFQTGAQLQEFDSGEVQAGDSMVLCFVLAEMHHMLALPAGFQLPPHTWPLVLPDNSHPAEYCEAAKIFAELHNFGTNSYALVPCPVSFHEASVDVEAGCLCYRPSSPLQALQFAQRVLDKERMALRDRVAEKLMQREFKTSIINIGLDDGCASSASMDAFRKFNCAYDKVVTREGSLQGRLQDIFDPLLPKMNERLEELCEETNLISSVSFAHSRFSQQRFLLSSPSTYSEGDPPSFVTVNNIDSQKVFSYCGEGVLDEVLVPRSCDGEEFMRQCRTVQRLFARQLRQRGRYAVWTAVYSVDTALSSRRDQSVEEKPSFSAGLCADQLLIKEERGQDQIVGYPFVPEGGSRIALSTVPGRSG